MSLPIISSVTHRERKISKSLSVEASLWELAAERAEALGISVSEYICCLIDADVERIALGKKITVKK